MAKLYFRYRAVNWGKISSLLQNSNMVYVNK